MKALDFVRERWNPNERYMLFIKSDGKLQRFANTGGQAKKCMGFCPKLGVQRLKENKDFAKNVNMAAKRGKKGLLSKLIAKRKRAGFFRQI